MTMTWHLYRTKEGAWVVYSDSPLNFTHSDKQWIEKRLMKYGMKPTEIDKLLQDEAEKGEGMITVPIGLDRSYQDGFLEQSD